MKKLHILTISCLFSILSISASYGAATPVLENLEAAETQFKGAEDAPWGSSFAWWLESNGACDEAGLWKTGDAEVDVFRRAIGFTGGRGSSEVGELGSKGRRILAALYSFPGNRGAARRDQIIGILNGRFSADKARLASFFDWMGSLNFYKFFHLLEGLNEEEQGAALSFAGAVSDGLAGPADAAADTAAAEDEDDPTALDPSSSSSSSLPPSSSSSAASAQDPGEPDGAAHPCEDVAGPDPELLKAVKKELIDPDTVFGTPSDKGSAVETVLSCMRLVAALPGEARPLIFAHFPDIIREGGFDPENLILAMKCVGCHPHPVIARTLVTLLALEQEEDAQDAAGVRVPGMMDHVLGLSLEDMSNALLLAGHARERQRVVLAAALDSRVSSAVLLHAGALVGDESADPEGLTQALRLLQDIASADRGIAVRAAKAVKSFSDRLVILEAIASEHISVPAIATALELADGAESVTVVGFTNALRIVETIAEGKRSSALRAARLFAGFEDRLAVRGVAADDAISAEAITATLELADGAEAVTAAGFAETIARVQGALRRHSASALALAIRTLPRLEARCAVFEAAADVSEEVVGAALAVAGDETSLPTDQLSATLRALQTLHEQGSLARADDMFGRVASAVPFSTRHVAWIEAAKASVETLGEVFDLAGEVETLTADEFMEGMKVVEALAPQLRAEALAGAMHVAPAEGFAERLRVVDAAKDYTLTAVKGMRRLAVRGVSADHLVRLMTLVDAIPTAAQEDAVVTAGHVSDVEGRLKVLEATASVAPEVTATVRGLFAEEDEVAGEAHVLGTIEAIAAVSREAHFEALRRVGEGEAFADRRLVWLLASSFPDATASVVDLFVGERVVSSEAFQATVGAVDALSDDATASAEAGEASDSLRAATLKIVKRRTLSFGMRRRILEAAAAAEISAQTLPAVEGLLANQGRASYTLEDYLSAMQIVHTLEKNLPPELLEQMLSLAKSRLVRGENRLRARIQMLEKAEELSEEALRVTVEEANRFMRQEDWDSDRGDCIGLSADNFVRLASVNGDLSAKGRLERAMAMTEKANNFEECFKVLETAAKVSAETFDWVVTLVHNNRANGSWSELGAESDHFVTLLNVVEGSSTGRQPSVLKLMARVSFSSGSAMADFRKVYERAAMATDWEVDQAWRLTRARDRRHGHDLQNANSITAALDALRAVTALSVSGDARSFVVSLARMSGDTHGFFQRRIEALGTIRELLEKEVFSRPAVSAEVLDILRGYAEGERSPEERLGRKMALVSTVADLTDRRLPTADVDFLAVMRELRDSALRPGDLRDVKIAVVQGRSPVQEHLSEVDSSGLRAEVLRRIRLCEGDNFFRLLGDASEPRPVVVAAQKAEAAAIAEWDIAAARVEEAKQQALLHRARRQIADLCRGVEGEKDPSRATQAKKMLTSAIRHAKHQLGLSQKTQDEDEEGEDADALSDDEDGHASAALAAVASSATAPAASSFATGESLVLTGREMIAALDRMIGGGDVEEAWRSAADEAAEVRAKALTVARRAAMRTSRQAA